MRVDSVARRLGRYVLHDAIASGGMGTVHLGRLLGTAGFRRLVAIKRMSPTIATDAEQVRRFHAEAAVAGRVLHPNVVSVIDVVAEAGELFLVMDFVRGDALSKLLAAERALSRPTPIAIAVSIMASVLEGLHAAHEAKDENGRSLGLVHRDVSPQNILVGADGSAKIADFGIARSTFDRIDEPTDAVRGKVRYLAPEQLGFDRRDIDRRVDVFAAGIVLWEALAGTQLFDAAEVPEVIEQILSGRVPSLRELRPDVSEPLAELVSACLSLSPADRPGDAAHLAARLEQVAGPLASPRAIGAWVQSLTAARLASLDEMVQRIESASTAALAVPDVDGEEPTVLVVAARSQTPPIAAPPLKLDDDSSTRTLTVDAILRPVAPARRRPPAWGIGAIAVGAAVSLTAYLLTRSPPSASSGTGDELPRAEVAPGAVASAMSVSTAVEHAGTAAPEPTHRVEPSASAAPSSSAPNAPPTNRFGPRPKAPTRASSKPTSTIAKPYVADRP